MTFLWLTFGVMLVAGILFICAPLYRSEKRLTLRSLSGAVVILVVAGGLYSVIGSPAAPSGAAPAPTVDDMINGLAARLARNPDDPAGWTMLGRSYMQLDRYDEAVAAFEQALEHAEGPSAPTLADLGEAVLLQQDQQMGARATGLFEAALSAAPDHPKALFYGGIAAIERGDRLLAADRWETLLAQSPPENVQQILRERINEWRGTVAGVEPAATTSNGAALTLAISVAPQARAALPDSTTVFIIARDPAQPSPPIAVTRRKLDELPANVTLSDADSMIPGRTLGRFQSLEIVVRASASGDPLPAAGDWSGSVLIDRPVSGTVDVSINEPVQ